MVLLEVRGYSMKIEILGSGCAKCKSVEKLVRDIIEELGIQADIVKVEDLQEIIDRGVMMTPAIFIDGESKIVGRVPSVKELKDLLIK
jgi:small redox-active disulfide protein 2